ncbi:MAG: hypothetical protein O0X49_03150, partial [Methanocorpusculum sp.]|nr:hypothetical protein [Methanocorpusculum sp.]
QVFPASLFFPCCSVSDAVFRVFFSVEFRVFCVFRGYSKQDQSKRLPNTASPVVTPSETTHKKAPENHITHGYPKQKTPAKIPQYPEKKRFM